MIDVHMLLMKLQRVEDDLEVLKSASSQAELIEGMERFGDSAHELMTQVNKFSLSLFKVKSQISWGWHWLTFKNIGC